MPRIELSVQTALHGRLPRSLTAQHSYAVGTALWRQCLPGFRKDRSEMSEMIEWAKARGERREAVICQSHGTTLVASSMGPPRAHISRLT